MNVRFVSSSMLGRLAGRVGRDFGQLPTDLLGLDYGRVGNLLMNAQISVESDPRPTGTLKDEIDTEQTEATAFVLKKFGGIY